MYIVNNLCDIVTHKDTIDEMLEFINDHFELSAQDVLDFCEMMDIHVKCIKSAAYVCADTHYQLMLVIEGSEIERDWQGYRNNLLSLHNPFQSFQ